MEKTASARRAHLRYRRSRRAALLAGTGLFLHAAPAWAVNECGPPPMSGTVVCPAGEYPNGVDYFVPFGPIEFRLEPGFRARAGSTFEGSNIRIIGPNDTSFSASSNPFDFAALYVFVLGPAFVDIDDVHGTLTGRVGMTVLGSRSVIVKADTVTSVGAQAVGAVEIFHIIAPASVPLTGMSIRTNSVSTTGNNAGAIRGSSEQGDVAVVSGAIRTIGDRSPGITVDSPAASTVESGSIITSGDDSYAISATGGTKVTISSGSISTSGESSPAITASTDGGPISITSGSIETAQVFGDAIRATDFVGNGPITIKSDRITTRGAFASPGIFAFTRGSVDIASNAVTTFGNGSTAIEANGASVAIGSGSISTSGASSRGIEASASGDVDIVSGSITTAGQSGIGIRANAQAGHVNVTSTSIVTRGSGGFGLQAEGIDASSVNGDVSVTSGSVSTIGGGAHGISASSSNKNVRVVSNTISIAGAFAHGIIATSNGGSIAVDSGTVATSAEGANGVRTFAFGSGTTSIRTGSITTQGPQAFGVRAFGRTGAVNVTVDGSVVTSGAGSPGIFAESGGPVSVSVNNVSTSGANSDAIIVKGSTSLVTIRGLVQSSHGLAVRAEDALPVSSGAGGPTTVNIVSGGTLRGRISLTPGADRAINAGTFDALGTSQFGLGTDLFDNNEGGTVRSVGGTATFAGLETFNNRGLIEMRDGAADDRLVLSGAYAGTGGARLGLDVDFAAGTADRLMTGAATGSTTIQVQGSGGGFTSGILVVDGGAGTSATAFTLAGGSSSAYLTRALSFDSANNDFLLVQLPGTAVFETARFGRMASQLWYESADAVAAQLDTVRDGNRGRGMALWLQGWTGERERSGTQTLAGAGTFDVSYEQDFQGLQGGIDFQAGSGVVGVTGGAGRSDAVFAATGNPVDMEVRNVGLYAQVGSGPLFFNALAKRDWAELEIAPGAGLGAEFDADLFGVQFNAGLRLSFGALYAEPSVGISWVQADLDSFESGPATVEPGDVESLRARAGLRLGARVPLAGGTFLPYLAANAYEELGDRNSSDFTLGQTLRLFDEPAGTRGQAAAGLAFAKAGFEAFVRGEMDFSGGADSKAVRAGARLRF